MANRFNQVGRLSKKLPVPPEPAPPAVDAAFKVAVIYELRKHILFKHGHGAGVEIEFWKTMYRDFREAAYNPFA